MRRMKREEESRKRPPTQIHPVNTHEDGRESTRAFTLVQGSWDTFLRAASLARVCPRHRWAGVWHHLERGTTPERERERERGRDKREIYI